MAHVVEQTKMWISARYLSSGPGHVFGHGEKLHLPEFIAAHAAKDKRVMMAEGVDGDGNPQSFSFELHERPLPGQDSDGDVTACFKLCVKYARSVNMFLDRRLNDLRNLEGTKLFLDKTYLDDDILRVAAFKKWLKQLDGLFRHKLPGFKYNNAVTELWMFTSTMHSQHHHEDFFQALSNTLRDSNWQLSYPNIMLIWQAVAVLPLSTVDCERGFSKQNLIKTWARGSMGDITLGHLMRCSLLDYDVDWFDVVAIFRGEKPRRTIRDFTGAIPSSAQFAELENATPSAAPSSVGGGNSGSAE
ncbi:hypothetical protein CLOM_g20803 [Closterium sp. NIES-68]|nr:hypothetical protein CLOM_g20803 [Closterium sp. NIES-68]GJP81387.1 hypothetical protein CLOP_g11547 [Closterium sp. NIES-67]